MASVFKDVLAMHQRFNIPKYDLIKTSDEPDQQPMELIDMMEFRMKFLQEELDELTTAYNDGEPLEIIDAVMDMMVVGIGLLAQLSIEEEQMQAHWDEVFIANMTKVRVENKDDSKRGHSFDLAKPAHWKGPNHDAILHHYYYK